MMRTQLQDMNVKASRLKLAGQFPAVPFEPADPVVAKEQTPPQSTKTIM